MPLTDQDIRIMAAEVLADTPTGGGRMSGVEVVDGQSNNLFDDIADLDRTMGNVSTRKVFPAVMSGDRQALYGSMVIVDQPPADPNVSVALFTTRDWADRRPAATSRMESYLARGPLYDGWLWDQHIAGQRALQILQPVDRDLPAVGSTIVLVKFPGQASEVSQFLRITRVTAQQRSFTASGCSGSFILNVVTVEISDALLFDALGGVPHCNRDTAVSGANCKLYSTVVADAARYAGIARLAAPVSMGDLSVQLQSIFGALVPSAQTEIPIADVKPNGDRALLIAAAGSPAQINFGTVRWDIGQALFIGQGIVPGSLQIQLGAVTLTDRGGQLFAGTQAVGTVDYGNGIAYSTAQPTNTAATVVTFTPAGQPVSNMMSAGWDVTAESRSGTLVFILQPIPTPGSLSIAYMAQGKWYVLRDDGSGALRGADSSFGSGTLNFTTGSVVVSFGALPDVGTTVLALWGTPALTLRRDGGTLKASVSLQLAHGGVAPGTLSISWVGNSGQTRTVTDNGAGNLTGDGTGSIDYVRGTVLLAPTNLPPGGAVYTVTYQYGPPLEETFPNPAPDANGNVTVQLANGNVLPGTVEVEWQVYAPESTYTSSSNFSVVWTNAALTQSNNLPASGKFTVARRDTGTGALRDTAGSTVDYTAGAITFKLATTLTIPRMQGQSAEWGSAIGQLQVINRFSATGVAYSTVSAVPPLDGSGYVKVRYRTSAAGNAASETFSNQPLTLDLTPQFAEQIVPGSVRFSLGSFTYIDRQGRVVYGVNPANGAATDGGQIDYASGQVTLTAWNPGDANTGSVAALLTTLGVLPVDEVTFRTASAPLRPGSLVLQYVPLIGGGVQTVTAQTNGTISAAGVDGRVDYQTGIVRVRFGSWVTAAGNESEPWYLASAVRADGKIFKPAPVVADTLRYAAVAYGYIPLDKTLLGIDPVRLPTDGRVPMFRVGDIVVLHDEQTLSVANPSNGGTTNLGRTRLKSVVVRDATGARVPTSSYSVDLDAGIVTWGNVSGLALPLAVTHRIEDQALVSDVQINGQISLNRPVSHAYPATAYCSSAVVMGTLRASVSVPFALQTWQNQFVDAPTGGAISAAYNVVQYPIIVTNAGAAQEKWAIVFDSPTTVRVIGQSVGQIAAGLPIAQEIAPLNPATNQPYFRIAAAGWGSGWAAGNALRFDTTAANYPIWCVRTVRPGPGTGAADAFTLALLGNADAP